MLERIREFLYASKYGGVNKKISENDLMFKADSVWYMHFGKAALYRILKTLEQAGTRSCEPQNILILPCGHGRELRFFRAHFTNAKITACDIDRDGVDFCAENFDAEAVYSVQNPELIPMSGKFDIIWCGSLLTHLDKNYWRAFLQFFCEHLNETGIFVFSTHGKFMTENFRSGKFDLGIDLVTKKAMLEQFDRTGFGYGDYCGQKDYGISLSSKKIVYDLVAKTPGLEILDYVERGWFSNHDTIACMKKNFS